MQPLISIITVCFNSAATIRDTLESMTAQTYQNFQYIVVDGASRDNTVQIVEEYRPKFGSRLTLISEPDHGIYDAMNKGIRLAKGELVGIVNSDDWLQPDALEIMAGAWDGTELAVLYGLMRTTTAAGQEIECHMNSHLNLNDLPMCHPAMFVTRRCYEEFGLYDTAYKCAADYDMELRLRDCGRVKFVPVYRLISNFRHGGVSSGSTYTAVADAAAVKLAHGISTKKQYDHTILYHKIRRFFKD